MKSEAQKTRIVAKKIAGKSDRQIAREEGINRETVGRILKASQFQQVMRAFREEMLQLIPESISHYRRVLERANDPEQWLSGTYPKNAQVRGTEVNKAIGAAYQRGFEAGINATKVASDVLHGTQVFVKKLEQATSAYVSSTEQLSVEELEARIIKGLQRIAEAAAPGGA